MSTPLTVKQLLKHCQDEIKKGHGDRIIALSNDDEGNGYHYCWYSFTTPEDLNSGFDDIAFGIDGLSDSVAPLDNTIILG